MDSGVITRMLGEVIPTEESHSFLMNPYGQIIDYQTEDNAVYRQTM